MTWLKTWRVLWRIYWSTPSVQRWFFVTDDLVMNENRIRDGLIRYQVRRHLHCPLQAIGYNVLPSSEALANIIFAADSHESPWRKQLLWATRLAQ